MVGCPVAWDVAEKATQNKSDWFAIANDPPDKLKAGRGWFLRRESESYA